MTVLTLPVAPLTSVAYERAARDRKGVSRALGLGGSFLEIRFRLARSASSGTDRGERALAAPRGLSRGDPKEERRGTAEGRERNRSLDAAEAAALRIGELAMDGEAALVARVRAAFRTTGLRLAATADLRETALRL